MRRFAKVLKYLALGVAALVAVALLVNFVANAWASRRLERKIAALRDAGQPVTLADLARKPIPPETNAATYLRRAKAEIEAIEAEVETAMDAAPQADQDRFYEGRPTPALKKTIQSALAAYPKVIPLLEQAGKCPDYDPQFDVSTDTGTFVGSIIANTSSVRSVMRILNYQTLQQISDGKREAALDTCLLMLRLCRHFDREPLLIGYLVGLACRGVTVRTADIALRSGPLSDASRDALEAELARHEASRPFQYTLVTERAYGLQSFRELGYQIDSGPIGPWWYKNDASGYLDLMDEMIAPAARPYTEADRARAHATSMAAANAGVLTRLLFPALQATMEARCRGQAQMHALRVLNALGRRSDAASAALPKLSDLGLPTEATIDPYDGKPLRLKKLPGGWLIYAVGQNLKDDGGKLTDLEDVGLGPPEATVKQPNADASKPRSAKP